MICLIISTVSLIIGWLIGARMGWNRAHRKFRIAFQKVKSKDAPSIVLREIAADVAVYGGLAKILTRAKIWRDLFTEKKQLERLIYIG